MNKSNECNQLDVLDMIECIVKHLNEVIEGEYETFKESIGFKHLFRGLVMRDWKGKNLQCRKYRELNKTLFKKLRWFYKQCLDDRNERFHDEKKQKRWSLQWYEKTTENVMENEPIQVRMFAQITNRNFNNSSASEMKQWICNVNAMK